MRFNHDCSGGKEIPSFEGTHFLGMCFACEGSVRRSRNSFRMPRPLCKQVELYLCFVTVLIDCLAFVTFVEMLIVRLVKFIARRNFSLSGLATRRELQLLEGEADLGKVWHVPISWSMIMIRRCVFNEDSSSPLLCYILYLTFDHLSRAKEASVEVAEKKELIGTLAKFQMALEKIDSYHHVVLPPLYRQEEKLSFVLQQIIKLIILRW